MANYRNSKTHFTSCNYRITMSYSPETDGLHIGI